MGPWDSEEAKKDDIFRKQVFSNNIKSRACIGFWADICGFGSLLEKSSWELSELNNNGDIQLLRSFYDINGRCLLPGTAPYPYDITMIVNDGIAKTMDLSFTKQFDSYDILFYIRDLFFSHVNFLRYHAIPKGVSLRSVLAGGEFIPYTVSSLTGNSVLQYDENNPSDYGKKILRTTYVYNPTEFQMNTAYAKAFTIEGMGSKSKIRKGYFYIEDSTLTVLNNAFKNFCKVEDDKIVFYYKRIPRMEFFINNIISLNIKGLKVVIYEISKFHIYKELDGDDVVEDLLAINNGLEL